MPEKNILVLVFLASCPLPNCCSYKALRRKHEVWKPTAVAKTFSDFHSEQENEFKSNLTCPICNNRTIKDQFVFFTVFILKRPKNLINLIMQYVNKPCPAFQTLLQFIWRQNSNLNMNLKTIGSCSDVVDLPRCKVCMSSLVTPIAQA